MCFGSHLSRCVSDFVQDLGLGAVSIEHGILTGKPLWFCCIPWVVGIFQWGAFFFGNYFVSVLGIFWGVSVSLVLCISAVLLLCVLLFCFSAFPCFCCYPSLLSCFSTVLLLYFFLICCFSSLTKPQETQYKYALPQTSPPEN